MDDSLSPLRCENSVLDCEEAGPETEFDADFVDKIRVMFDVIQRKEERNGSSSSIVIDHSKVINVIYPFVAKSLSIDLQQITNLLDFFRNRRSQEKDSHGTESQTKADDENQSLHNIVIFDIYDNVVVPSLHSFNRQGNFRKWHMSPWNKLILPAGCLKFR